MELLFAFIPSKTSPPEIKMPYQFRIKDFDNIYCHSHLVDKNIGITDIKFINVRVIFAAKTKERLDPFDTFEEIRFIFIPRGDEFFGTFQLKVPLPVTFLSSSVWPITVESKILRRN